MKELYNAARAAALIALVWIVSALPTLAQWQTPQYSVPVGRGAGTGFSFAAPPNYGALLAGTDSSTNPSFSNIIRGQNYGSAMTNTGEAYGYSFRNSTTTGATIYSAIFPGVSNQDGIQSVMHVPSTATVEQGTGFSSYFQSDSAATNSVGYFAAGIGTVANVPLWGINTLLMDNATRTTHSRTGQILIGYEADFNVMGANTQVIGMSVGGNGLAQSANAIGFIVNSLSGLSTGTYRWQTGFTCLNATVVAGNDCVQIGAQQTSGTNIDSLYLSFQYFNASGVQKNFQVYGTSGVTTQGSLRIASNDTTSLLEVGYGGSSAGRLFLAGSSSGGHLIISQAAASGTLTVPNATGTLVATASSPLAIDATTGNLSWTGLTQYGVIYANATTGVASTAAGTSTKILHGNASGAPTWSAVVSADLNITTTSCTNQFVTAISSGGVGTCTTDTLASAQHANQGTTTTVLHGNASGNPSWGAVSLTADITGTLGVGNGGTGITSGTSGGVPYFSASNTIASSGALTANAIVKGGGAGAAPVAAGVSIDGSNNITPSADDGGALGTSALKWSDLFLASGAVVNWGASNVTLTHSSNAIAFYGANYITYEWSGNTADSVNVLFRKSRGAIVQNGDSIGKFLGQGFDGSGYQAAALIAFEIDGTPGAGDMPGRITFYTTPDGSATLAEAFRVDNTQRIQFAAPGLAANGSVATVLGSVGPTGAHTTVQEWIVVKGSSGNVRYIPAF